MLTKIVRGHVFEQAENSNC